MVATGDGVFKGYMPASSTSIVPDGLNRFAVPALPPAFSATFFAQP